MRKKRIGRRLLSLLVIAALLTVLVRIFYTPSSVVLETEEEYQKVSVNDYLYDSYCGMFFQLDSSCVLGIESSSEVVATEDAKSFEIVEKDEVSNPTTPLTDVVVTPDTEVVKKPTVQFNTVTQSTESVTNYSQGDGISIPDSNVISLLLDGNTLSVSNSGLKISNTLVNNWNSAYSWGDHSTQGYITDGNTGWDNTYGLITDGNTLWDNSYGFITDSSTDILTNKSGNISQWSNDSGYITDGNTNWDNTYGFILSLDYSEIINGSGVYFDYKPNDVACSNDQVLKYDDSLGWICANDNGGSSYTAGTGLALVGSEFSIDGTYDDNFLLSTATYADPSWLTSLSGSKVSGDISGNAGSVTNGLYITSSFDGDVSGTYNALVLDNTGVISGTYGSTGASIAQITVDSKGRVMNISDRVLTKTDLSLNNVENTALSTWSGTSNITTVGTITSGSWDADDIPLGSKTSGNYVQGATVNAGLTMVGTEGGTLGIILDGTTLSLSSSGLKISDVLVSNWNNAYSWGDHSAQGYISDGNVNWDNSYGFITASSTDTLTNKSGFISQWSNDSGYITDGNTSWNNSYGFITASSTDTLTNKSGNISQWSNDSGYITDGNTNWDNIYGFVTSLNYSEITNGSGVYLDYKPNNVACLNSEVLKYDDTLGWICAPDIDTNTTYLAGGGLVLVGNEFSIDSTYDDNFLLSTATYADPSWLTSLSGSKVSGDISGNAGSVTNGLYITSSFDGDVSGTYNALVLDNTGVTSGTYGSTGASIAQITVDSKGRATSIINRDITKGDIGLGSVENTALSTWSGSSNITTVGTITSGTWAGDDLVLGVSTSGNYVQGATSNGGLVMTGTEGGTLGIVLDGTTLSLSASGLKISDGLTSNWNEAYSWGDHSLAGYIMDGNTGWDNSYGLITDGNTNWDNIYGFVTASSTTTFTNKSGNISQWTNNSGYITDGNTGWDNTYGFITDGNQGWNNSYGYITDGNTNWNNSYGFVTSDVKYAAYKANAHTYSATNYVQWPIEAEDVGGFWVSGGYQIKVPENGTYLINANIDAKTTAGCPRFHWSIRKTGSDMVSANVAAGAGEYVSSTRSYTTYMTTSDWVGVRLDWELGDSSCYIWGDGGTSTVLSITKVN